MEAKVKSDIPLETVGRTPRAGVVQKNEVASMKTRLSTDLKIVPGVPKGLRASIRYMRRNLKEVREIRV
eukprot:1394347-Amorphochlora_amoeboformis.AAC.1